MKKLGSTKDTLLDWNYSQKRSLRYFEYANVKVTQIARPLCSRKRYSGTRNKLAISLTAKIQQITSLFIISIHGQQCTSDCQDKFSTPSKLRNHNNSYKQYAPKRKLVTVRYLTLPRTRGHKEQYLTNLRKSVFMATGTTIIRVQLKLCLNHFRCQSETATATLDYNPSC